MPPKKKLMLNLLDAPKSKRDLGEFANEDLLTDEWKKVQEEPKGRLKSGSIFIYLVRKAITEENFCVVYSLR